MTGYVALPEGAKGRNFWSSNLKVMALIMANKAIAS